MSESKPEIEIRSDSDWKRQVKEEAAKLDAERDRPATDAAQATSPAQASSPSAEPASTAAEPSTFPPADFTMLVSMFSTQAMVSLGVIPSPETGKPEANLPLAKHFIDLLGVLQEKTRRNLTGHESNLLESSLHELRIAYVELSKTPPPETSA